MSGLLARHRSSSARWSEPNRADDDHVQFIAELVNDNQESNRAMEPRIANVKVWFFAVILSTPLLDTVQINENKLFKRLWMLTYNVIWGSDSVFLVDSVSS